MAGFLTNIEHFFKQKSILANLIAINIGVFLLVRLCGIFATLFNLDPGFIMEWLHLPADITQLIVLPWTIITYMFTHFGFLHILFNMLWLYWFGQMFLLFFNSRQLMGLYLLGGIAGAILFILSYNTFPYFNQAISYSYLIGASASVMAIVFGVAFYRKDFEVGLLFLGRVKIIYLALFTLVLDLLSVTSTNAGGHIAHIGGALLGFLYAHYMLKGKDITSSLNFIIDKIVNLFKKRPDKKKMKVTYKNPSTGNNRNADYDYNARKKQEQAEIDKILDKIKKSGYASLTEEEKKKLFDASNKY